MGLLDEVAKEAVANKATACAVGRWLDSLDPKDRVEVVEVLNSSYPKIAIWRVISRHYRLVFAARTLTKHLERNCCCVAQG